MGEETKGITEPISPELVLIDAELAAAARALLPGYSLDYAGPAPRPVGPAEEDAALVGVPEPQTERLKWADDREVQLDSWERKAPSWRILATVGVVVATLFALFALAVLSWRGSADEPRAAHSDGASASSGTGPDVPRIPETATLAGGTTVPEEPLPESSERTQRTATTAERPLSPPHPPPFPPPRAMHSGRPPSNVLGVVVTAGSHRVTLRWQRPAGAVDVIILRRPGRHGAERTVYEGTGNTYVDRNVRDRVAYRYLIISRDSLGRLSSGVPTVVTPGERS